jgi:hypothetical protein
MDKLKGSGATFSTSGKRWQPFQINRKLTARAARLHRLKRKGLTPPGDKQSLRELAQDAALKHRITKIPMKSTER